MENQIDNLVLSSEVLEAMRRKNDAKTFGEINEEPIPEPDFLQEEEISVVVSDNIDVDVNDDISVEEPQVTIEDPIEEEPVAAISVPEEPVVVTAENEIIEEPVVAIMNAPEKAAAPLEIYEPEPEPVRAQVHTERKPNRDNAELRRPDSVFGDVIIGYRQDGTVVKSRTLYNKSLNGIHHKYWRNSADTVEQQFMKVTINAYVRYKKDGTPTAYLWDEGGKNRNKGFASTVTDQDGNKLEPISVFIPELESRYHDDDTIYLNWRHAKLPVEVGYHVLTCSTTFDREGNGSLFITNYRVTEIILPKNRKDTQRPVIKAELESYFTTEGENMIVNPLVDDTPISYDAPVISALIKQCENPRSDKPTFCHWLISTRGKDYRAYLSDKKFNELSEKVEYDNDELVGILNDLMQSHFEDICNEENEADDENQFNQLRLYRVSKYFAKSDDIAIFYYLVRYNPKDMSYGDHRIFYGYSVVTPNDDNIVLIGNEEKCFTFEELKQSIVSSERNQAIAEFRKVF